eukprot:TRINITY_DN27386_c0_g1_i1.p1 TRINITY_DN27386_c0_g1~~TRINITY_DN27386_c0_g1_i1.p1  ORF type:complete len:516 (+),score=104.33 TRINITY_DN27386_c0_g1_i1:63-1610(+)
MCIRDRFIGTGDFEALKTELENTKKEKNVLEELYQEDRKKFDDTVVELRKELKLLAGQSKEHFDNKLQTAESELVELKRQIEDMSRIDQHIGKLEYETLNREYEEYKKTIEIEKQLAAVEYPERNVHAEQRTTITTSSTEMVLELERRFGEERKSYLKEKLGLLNTIAENNAHIRNLEQEIETLKVEYEAMRETYDSEILIITEKAAAEAADAQADIKVTTIEEKTEVKVQGISELEKRAYEDRISQLGLSVAELELNLQSVDRQKRILEENHSVAIKKIEELISQKLMTMRTESAAGGGATAGMMATTTTTMIAQGGNTAEIPGAIEERASEEAKATRLTDEGARTDVMKLNLKVTQFDAEVEFLRRESQRLSEEKTVLLKEISWLKSQSIQWSQEAAKLSVELDKAIKANDLLRIQYEEEIKDLRLHNQELVEKISQAERGNTRATATFGASSYRAGGISTNVTYSSRREARGNRFEQPNPFNRNNNTSLYQFDVLLFILIFEHSLVFRIQRV